MNALIRKEIRLLLPSWGVAMLLAIAVAFVPFLEGRRADWIQLLLAIGMPLALVFLTMTSFGQEFATGTFSQLLTQPISRERLWWIKLGALAGSVFSVWLVLVYCGGIWGFGSKEFDAAIAFTGISMLVIFSGGLWTTLLLRQMAAAFWFVLTIPLALNLAYLAIARTWFGDAEDRSMAYGALLVYAVLGIVFARWLFLRAQDVPWSDGYLSLRWRLWSGTAAGVSLDAPKRQPFRAVFRKEGQSHQVAFWLGGVMFLLHLIALLIRKHEYNPGFVQSTLYEALGFWWVLWFGLPLLIGAQAVAGERKQGTLEGLLCLPVNRKVLWGVKLFWVILLGALFGGIMPWAMERIGLGMGIPESPVFWDMRPTQPLWERLITMVLIAAAISVATFHASTLTRNLLQALGASVLIPAFFGFCVATIPATFFRTRRGCQREREYGSYFRRRRS